MLCGTTELQNQKRFDRIFVGEVLLIGHRCNLLSCQTALPFDVCDHGQHFIEHSEADSYEDLRI